MPPTRVLCLVLGLLPGAGFGCGPDFPPSLLDQREYVLFELPSGSFDHEVGGLVSVSGLPFKAVEAVWPESPPGQRAVDLEGLSRAQQLHVRTLYAQAGAAEVYAQAAELPQAVMHYTAGAVAWHGRDLASARAAFEAVLGLPAEEAGARGPMALYMLGRIAYVEGEAAAAAAAFAKTRDRIAAGAPDPLGLAVASFGEQARIELEAGRAIEAVTLYARQAALGSGSGRTSLLFLARRLAPDAQVRAELMRDEVGRGLLLAYLFARAHELPPELPEPGAAFQPYHPWESTPGREDSAAVQTLLAEFAAALPADAPVRDRLAAVAYRAGRFAQAQELLGAADSALAQWLRAKLALRAGEDAAAAAAYARALQQLGADARPTAEAGFVDPMTSSYQALDLRCRIGGEAGTLALSRGDFLQAMELFFAASSKYWRDAAYLAERVLTVEELRFFVDRISADRTAAPAQVEAALYGSFEPVAALRLLLARRLLREGQGEASLAYFEDSGLGELAADYLRLQGALDDAGLAGPERARAGFAAAQLARAQGADLIGFQLDPDYLEFGGNFDLNSSIRWDSEYRPMLVERVDIAVPEPFSTPAERERVKQSVARPLHRFHYRGVAANLAERAAGLLPPRSQAYAALMCEATRYVLNSDPPRAQQLYRRYLREGPYVPWGERFGQECPAPDFDKLERELHAARVAEFKRLAKWSLPPALLLALIGGLFWRRRRSAAAQN
jgi:cellulose synthase operon protein C